MDLNLRSISVTLFAFLCLGGFMSCHAGSASEADFTEGEAKAFLRIGVERGAIIGRFGKPMTETTATDGSTVLTFLRPFSSKPKPSPAPIHFAGFQVYLRDNKLIHWDPITSDAPEP
jgi:hypothetical protein